MSAPEVMAWCKCTHGNKPLSCVYAISSRKKKERQKKMIFVVIWHSTLLGCYSCGVDGAETARRFPGATVTECRLNSETVHGAKMLAPDPQLAA